MAVDHIPVLVQSLYGVKEKRDHEHPFGKRRAVAELPQEFPNKQPKRQSENCLMIDKKELLKLYREAGPITRTYLKIKLRICPLLKLEEYFPKEATIVDLGCGNGLFPNILNVASADRQIFGIDLDEKKIEIANQTKAPDSNIFYQTGDVVEAEYPQGDVFSLVDVLYLIPYDKHELILQKCYRSLPPGGILILKEMDTKPRWKYLWNLFQETLAVKLIAFTLGERFYFRSQKDYTDLLQRLGFSVKPVPLDSGYWYPHIAYICTK